MDAHGPYDDLLAAVPVRQGTVPAAGGTTAYWDYGPEDAADVLLAVHGFRGDHHGFEPIVAHLPGMRVIVPDLPGFGRTAPLPDRTHDLDAYVDWLRDVVAAVAPTCLVGHSFGSIVAAAGVAAGLPVRRLVLINPIGAPALEGPRGILTRLAVLYYAAGARLPRPAGEALLRNRVVVRVMSMAMLKTRDPVLRRFAHDQHDRYFSTFADRDVLRQAFETSVSHDVREFAARIDVPTLLIAADRDDITPLDKERELAALIPQARLEVITGVGHLIHYETPGQAADAVSRFLAPAPGEAAPGSR